MKLFKRFSMVFVCSFLFMGCVEDEGQDEVRVKDGPVTIEALAGTWKYIGSISELHVDGELISSHESDGEGSNYTKIYKVDGTFQILIGEATGAYEGIHHMLGTFDGVYTLENGRLSSEYYFEGDFNGDGEITSRSSALEFTVYFEDWNLIEKLEVDRPGNRKRTMYQKYKRIE